MGDKDARILELETRLEQQEADHQEQLAAESALTQQQFLEVHEQSMRELGDVHREELGAARELAELWEARANAAAEALHALEEQTDERDRLAHERMREAFAEAHEKDVEELCEEVASLRAQLADTREQFAARLEMETATVVEEAVRSAVEGAELAFAAQRRVDAELNGKLQLALAAALKLVSRP
jgi:DNA-binding transcriptional regulator YiaG